MKQTCGSCRFSVKISPISKKDIPATEKVRCGKYGSHKTYLANKVNDCMEWEPKKLST